MTEPVRVEVTIAASADEVWRALREPGLIRHWHGWEYDENGGLDEEIRQIFLTDVTESADSHTLTLSGGDVFTLHDAGEGRTLVRIVRAPKGTNPDWDDFYEDINEGWITFTQQLRFALERHPGAARRTVFLDGTGDPFSALGLDHAAAGRYTASLAREPVSGEVWFASANQAGYTVDSWGDGLLIIGNAPTRAMAVLTTYGLDDEAYQALHDRWTAWWSEALPKVEVSA